MDKRSYSTEGIILSRRNYGEADRILTIFTKRYGKIRVIAKGIRKTTSRKRGSLELFSCIRFFAARGRNMDVITEVEEKNNFYQWRSNLNYVAVAYHLSEVVEKLTPEHQEHDEIFDALFDAYSNIHLLHFVAIRPFVESFKVKILEELGFLERGQETPKNLDFYIEDLINGKLRSRSFLTKLGK